MKQTKFDQTRDQRIADDEGKSQRLMCSAKGCPNLWSASVGNLCRWHADAEPHHWPRVTQEAQDSITERALLLAQVRDAHRVLGRVREGSDVPRNAITTALQTTGDLPTWADDMPAFERDDFTADTTSPARFEAYAPFVVPASAAGRYVGMRRDGSIGIIDQ